jgi:hypothetical protein
MGLNKLTSGVYSFNSKITWSLDSELINEVTILIIILSLWVVGAPLTLHVGRMSRQDCGGRLC